MEAAVFDKENHKVRLRFAIVFLLVSLDLMIKAAFRFEWFGADFFLALIEDRIFVDQIIFNYGNMLFPSRESMWGSVPIAFFNWILIVFFTLVVTGDEDASLIFMLLLSGSLANEIDRLVFGNVCDWLTLSLSIEGGAIANFADLLIWSGQAILVLACIKDNLWVLALFLILVCFALPIWMMV